MNDKHFQATTSKEGGTMDISQTLPLKTVAWLSAFFDFEYAGFNRIATDRIEE